MAAKILKDDVESDLQNWQNILWREWRHCDDQDYARFLYKTIYRGPFTWFHRLAGRGQARPYAAEVETALRRACQAPRGAGYMWKKYLSRLEEAKAKSTPLEKLIANLQDDHWFERLMARHVLLHRGGEVVRSLWVLAQDSTSPIQQTALWLLESISADTTARLAPKADHLLCPQCLVYCYAHRIDLLGQADLTYYGCRVCGQSRSFQTRFEAVVVVLDAGMLDRQIEQAHQLRVNWFQHRVLFDFDRVEIVQATDEAVERFAIQVGNDTDPLRKPHYQQMPCRIGAACRLSENTLRILESMFGQVVHLSQETYE